MTLGNLRIPELMDCQGIDALHDPNGIAPFLGDRGTRAFIVTLHEAFAYVHPSSHNWLDNWRYRWYLPYAVKRANAVITVSECSRCDLIAHLAIDPEKIEVIPEGVHSRFRDGHHGVDSPRILSRYGISPPYFLYVGALNARKNVPRILHAFDQVRANHPEMQLVLGGKRQWKSSEIDETFDRLALGDSVRFTGYIDDEDLPVLYSSALAFLFPSLYEGFGLPPLEAMACGTPVITSNVSSLPEVVGNAAMLVDPKDVASLAHGMELLVTDTRLRSNMGERGIQQASGFSWETAARRTLQVYDLVSTVGDVAGPSSRTSRLEERASAN
jgi:glycosyltransferase involved in cell wall biosynthesis